jgi:hypothetical protein
VSLGPISTSLKLKAAALKWPLVTYLPIFLGSEARKMSTDGLVVCWESADYAQETAPSGRFTQMQEMARCLGLKVVLMGCMWSMQGVEEAQSMQALLRSCQDAIKCLVGFMEANISNVSKLGSLLQTADAAPGPKAHEALPPFMHPFTTAELQVDVSLLRAETLRWLAAELTGEQRSTSKELTECGGYAEEGMRKKNRWKGSTLVFPFCFSLLRLSCCGWGAFCLNLDGPNCGTDGAAEGEDREEGGGKKEGRGLFVFWSVMKQGNNILEGKLQEMGALKIKDTNPQGYWSMEMLVNIWNNGGRASPKRQRVA